MIKYLDLQAINKPYEHAADEVLRSGWYLKGEWTRRFEETYAAYIGTKHCIGVANGLDALTLILRAYIEMGVMQEGDEVIVPANTYIASILAITENRLKPVLVEPSWDTLQIDDTLIEQAITPRTRAIMIVHLYGRCAYTDRIGELCRQHGLKLIEDNAQAHGCRCSVECRTESVECRTESVEFATAVPTELESRAVANSTFYTLHSKFTGSLGHAAAHSFYPGKNLGAFGDAGAVTTDDDELATLIRALGNYGSSQKYVFRYLGRNSRIDELQAAILLAKLPHLDADNQRRKDIADRYLREITNEKIQLPGNYSPLPSHYSPLPDERDCVWHIFPVFCERRDELQRYLADRGVETQIHYPIPPHRQQCYAKGAQNRLSELSEKSESSELSESSGLSDWSSLSLPITERIHAQELSIPCHQALTDGNVSRIIELMNNFK